MARQWQGNSKAICLLFYTLTFYCFYLIFFFLSQISGGEPKKALLFAASLPVHQREPINNPSSSSILKLGLRQKQRFCKAKRVAPFTPSFCLAKPSPSFCFAKPVACVSLLPKATGNQSSTFAVLPSVSSLT